jgi:hypothetical protein
MTDATYSYPTAAASTDPAGSAAVFLVIAAVLTVFLVASIVAMWKMFEKAGKPGWASIVPIYNFIVLLQIIGRPWWWILLLFIPFVSLIMQFVIAVELAKAYGRSTMFGIVALGLFSIVGYLILGFGKDKYVGPDGGGAAPAAPPAAVPPAATPAA